MKDLQEAAKELNEVLSLEPAIKVVGIKKVDLEAKLKEAAALIDPDEDEITEETIATLTGLGVWPGEPAEDDGDEAAPPAPAKGKGKGKDAPAPAKGKASAKKTPPPVEDDEDGEDGEEDGDDEDAPAPPAKGKGKAKDVPAPPAKGKASPKKETPAKKGPSAYGTAVELMCSNTHFTIKELTAAVAKKGVDVEGKSAALSTAYSAVKKISECLQANGWKAPKSKS